MSAPGRRHTDAAGTRYRRDPYDPRLCPVGQGVPLLAEPTCCREPHRHFLRVTLCDYPPLRRVLECGELGYHPYADIPHSAELAEICFSQRDAQRLGICCHRRASPFQGSSAGDQGEANLRPHGGVVLQFMHVLLAPMVELGQDALLLDSL